MENYAAKFEIKGKLFYGSIIELKNSTKIWKVLKRGASLHSNSSQHTIDVNQYAKLAEHFQRLKKSMQATKIPTNSFRFTISQVEKHIIYKFIILY